MKIKALNEPDTSNTTSDESSHDDGRQQALGKEALEDQYFEKYHQALVAIQEDHKEKARDLLEELEEELEDIESSNNETLHQLKFSVLRNLGNLVNDDVDYYVEALSLDSTDISLWIKSGDRGMKIRNFLFAKTCYEQALSMNPKNWIAIDRLVELYYILHLPFELYDICTRALTMNRNHKKAMLMINEATKLLPFIDKPSTSTVGSSKDEPLSLIPLQALKRKRQHDIQIDLQRFKRAKLGIILDTARTQSLASFGNYIIKIYDRFSKQSITRNTMLDITINNNSTFSQQFSNGSINSQSNNQNSSDPQSITCSQDIEMVADAASNSEPEKNENRTNEQATISNDDNDQTKSNRSRSNQAFQKNSSLSFAAMLFPTDLNDKRRSSRNRSNQDDTFSFKMKFDELNELLPECLRIGAIEQALQKRRDEQQISNETKSESEQDESILVETNLEPVREDLIIKNVIEDISGQAQATGTTISNIRLCDMFYVYLSKLAAKKQNTLPEAFIKIYKAYRKLCPLPTGVFLEIGSDGVKLEELWFTLTANEIAYKYHECAFLLRILEQLQMYLDENLHREFLVRLFLILGLNSDYKYLEMALQNIEEDTRVYASNRKIITRAHIKTLIDRQTEKMQQEASVEETDNSLEIIERLGPKSENEMSDREILLLCNAIKSAQLWQKGLDTLNQRNDLNSDIIIDTINTCLLNGAIMDAILASKLCKEAISGSRPTTWSCLYRGWLGVSSSEELENEETIRDMDKFFELGHSTLGKKNACVCDKGEFLMLHVEHLLNDNRDSFEERDLLGSTHCLFGYPTKKPTLVASHKATRVPMIWDYAQIIYHYLVPEELPTYMSLLRKVGITSELEVIFKEIAESVPAKLHPRSHVEVIENFIEQGEELSSITIEVNEVTQDLFYYLADYYFKNKDFNTARTYYNYDLVINPTRFDSWAASGLLRASNIDKALSGGSITTPDFVNGSIRKLADSAIRCFERATKLKPDEPKATLWIEFGNLTYNLTSLASRLYIYDDFESEVDNKEPTNVTELIQRHKQLYQLAKHCFTSANTLCACDEIWLHYYMLGKIHEKADPLKALEFYSKADSQLFIEGAVYPRKISYHNPPDLAYEAMEVHYRIHAAALKFLFTTTNPTQKSMNEIRKYLLSAQRSPFVMMESYNDPKKKIDLHIDRDVNLLLDDILDSVTRETSFEDLAFMCLHGMKRCLVRCDKNFKAIYRLSYYYRNTRKPRMAHEVLMSRDIIGDDRIQSFLAYRSHLPSFMAAPPDLNGIDSLFKDRKTGNLFFNIWRMPIEEIDRPGCFEHWMFKCTWQLINTCVDLKDTNMLTTIAFQLSRQPEMSKKYLQDRPRVLLVLFAVKSIIGIVWDVIDKSTSIDSKQKLIRDALILADKFVKSNVSTDKMHEFYSQLQKRCQTSGTLA